MNAGIASVRLALRLGFRVHQAATVIDPSIGDSRPWSNILSTILPDAEERLAGLFQDTALSPKPYISAVNFNSVTISGPPSILSSIPQKTTPVPIHAPYHAPHIFNSSDVDEVVGQLGELPKLDVVIPVISSSSGAISSGRTFTEQLWEASADILLRRLDLTRVAAQVTEIFTASEKRAMITPVSTGVAKSLLAKVNESSGGEYSINNIVMESAATAISAAPSGRSQDSNIAIIGMSGRFPDAAGTDEFWDLLYAGLDVHRVIPPDRFDAQLHCDPTGRRKNTSKVMNGCFIKEPGLFDPKFFNISPKEAEQSDPSQRLALETAYEALEMGGIVPDRTPSTQRERVGVFYGMTSDDWREVNSGQNVDTYFIPGGNRAFTPGRLNYYFKFSGPSVSLDTACSSSLAAIHMACGSLWRKDCDTAIAGGTNVLTNPDNFAGLDRGHFLSRTGNCNTFDNDADGYCRADGVGSVVLKRMEDAVADNDPIMAVIMGAYTNHSAESVSITRPHAGAQEYIFSKLLHESGVKPHDVSYIEMHGTGTQAGDATEMTSVLNTFAPDQSRKANQSLYLGSAKANVGHSESASGVVSLIKVLLMMQKNEIPPHCGIKGRINQHFPLDMQQRNVHIAFRPTPWVRPEGEKRRVFVNNFSAAGGNSALLLEDAPIRVLPDELDPRPSHIINITAKSATSLNNNIMNLHKYVSESHQTKNFLSKLSYTTTARRMHYPFRISVSAGDAAQLLESLKSATQQEHKRTRAAPPKIAFLFSGQGAQYAGMGRHLLESSSVFRSAIVTLDRTCISQGFPSILGLINGEISIEDVDPMVSQIGTVCLQIALAAYWKSLGVVPDFVLGHSLGHYAALNIAGVLSASDTIYLTGMRARLLKEKCNQGSHAMLAIKASADQVVTLIDSSVEIACVNGPQEVVVSGEMTVIDALTESLTDKGVKATKVKVPYAFHSAQVDPVLEDLGEIAASITFHTPQIPVASALKSELITEAEFGPEYLQRHCREAVNFVGAIDAARNQGFADGNTLWVELGPHTVCSGFVKSNMGQQALTVPSLRRNEVDWKMVASGLSTLYLSGVVIDWNEYHRDFAMSHEVLQLPKYSWDNKTYWIQYVHNWALTKGDPPSVAEPEVPQDNSSTASVQEIIQDSVEGSTVTVIAQSDFGSPLLAGISEGHKVNGAKLCTSSLYADIGLTLGERILEKHHPELQGYAVDVHDMNVDKSLMLRDGIPALFRMEVIHDKISLTSALSIYSVDTNGKKTLHHAHCRMRYEKPQKWLEEWQRNHYLIDRSIDYLESRVEQGIDSRLASGMIYKVFGTLLDYSQPFKGLSEAILNSEHHEATGKVKFQCDQGEFRYNPMWIDSCGQLTGFLMNGHEKTPKDTVYINHGWKSLKIAKPFKKDAIYRNYIRMQPIDGTKYQGDLYVIDNGEIVAVYHGMTVSNLRDKVDNEANSIKFMGIPRRILDTVLPPAGKTPAAAPASRQQPSAAPAAMAAQPPVRMDGPPPAEPGAGMIRPVLRILSEEIGLPFSSFTDDLIFADYGVDSLLSLTITGRIREDLGMDIDSAIFDTCATLGEFKLFLGGQDAAVDTASSSSISDSSSISSMTSREGLETPVDDQNDGILSKIVAVMVEEIGVSADDLTRSDSFEELGMDSLLSLTVLGRLREEHGLDLDSEFFVTNASFAAVKKVFQPTDAVKTSPAACRDVPQDIPAQFKAGSTLLQGNPKTARHTLFLFPDGSGSATSYVGLGQVSPDVCVVGLNCPWLKSAEHLVTFGIKGLAKLYVAEIRRRKPVGPYSFGGWSAGGISAYEAAIQLTLEGEAVDKLVLLDSPGPIGLEKLPPRLFHFLNGRGTFGDDGRKAPDWLLSHFLAFIDALDDYKPIPWSTAVGGTAPKTHMLWAEDGVCKHPSDPRPEYRDDDPREMRWLLENRTNFSPNGWDVLVGGNDISIERIVDANHFTMLKGGKNGDRVAEFLRHSFV